MTLGFSPHLDARRPYDNRAERTGQSFERVLLGEINTAIHNPLLVAAKQKTPDGKLALRDVIDIVKKSQPRPDKQRVFIKTLGAKVKEQLMARSRTMKPEQRQVVIRALQQLEVYTAVHSALDDFYIAGKPSGMGGFGPFDAFIEFPMPDGKGRFMVTIDVTRRDKSGDQLTASSDVQIYGDDNWQDLGENPRAYDEQVRQVASVIVDVIARRFQGEQPLQEPAGRVWRPRASGVRQAA